MIKGGNRPLPLMLLELGAVAFLIVVIWQRVPFSLPRTLWAGIALLVAYPVLQMLPIPAALWTMLPGHAQYAEIVTKFAPTDDGYVRRALSVIPSLTEYGWLALLPPLACFLVTLRLRADDVPRLLLAMAVFAGFEAMLGLLQVGSASESMFYFRTDNAFGTAVGTFANRNHYAGLLAMTLPIFIGLLSFSMRRERRRHHHRHGFKASTDLFSQRTLLFALAVLIFLALVFSRSRAGIATALVGLACSSLLLMRARGGVRHANLIVFALVGVGSLLALTIGIAPVLERIEPEQLKLSGEGRLLTYVIALRAALEFLPFGSGLSTFASVFPQFQTEALPGFINYAHNDYLQAFVEMGLAAPVIIGLLLAAYCMRMTALVQREGGRSFTILQIAAGIAMVPMILHSLFDFGLHIPAVAVWFATLAGMVFHRGAEAVYVHGKRASNDAPEIAE